MGRRYTVTKGTHDVVPPAIDRWRFLENEFASLVRLYGYQEVRTPTFEETDLFVRSSGDTSEVVTKQMYTFEDESGRSLTLKPEGTAPLIRSYLEHDLGHQGHVTRLWYQTPIFRYEQPQKGRYREAHQVGLELIGSSSPAADAEVIEVTVRFYERLGINDVNVIINCIGRKDARREFGSMILDHISGWLKDQGSDVQARATKNPLRLLDSKDPSVIEAVAGAPSISAFLSDDSKKHFDQVQAFLGEVNVSFTVDTNVVRGLDYYTDTVFEVQSTMLGAQSALCGGGRYDDLIKDIGGPPMPAVGVAMGIERAVIVMDQLSSKSSSSKVDVYLAADSVDSHQFAVRLGRLLRERGLATGFSLGFKNLKGQMKEADQSAAWITLIVGDREIQSFVFGAKNMRTGEQSELRVEKSTSVSGLDELVRQRIDRAKNEALDQRNDSTSIQAPDPSLSELMETNG